MNRNEIINDIVSTAAVENPYMTAEEIEALFGRYSADTRDVEEIRAEVTAYSEALERERIAAYTRASDERPSFMEEAEKERELNNMLDQAQQVSQVKEQAYQKVKMNEDGYGASGTMFLFALLTSGFAIIVALVALLK